MGSWACRVNHVTVIICPLVCFSHQTKLPEASILRQDFPSIQHSAWHVPELSRYLLGKQHTQSSIPGTSVCVCRGDGAGGHPKLEWHWATSRCAASDLRSVVPPALASPGSSALDTGSGCQDTGLQTVSHNEGSQPCLDPHQPGGQWVSCPVQHHPCKYTSISSSTDSLGQDAGRTTWPSTPNDEVCHCVFMWVSIVKPGTSPFLTFKATWVCVLNGALCGRWGLWWGQSGRSSRGLQWEAPAAPQTALCVHRNGWGPGDRSSWPKPQNYLPGAQRGLDQPQLLQLPLDRGSNSKGPQTEIEEPRPFTLPVTSAEI